MAQGNLTITSARTIFAGHQTIVIPHERVVGFEAYRDGLRIDDERRKRPYSFSVPDGELAVAILSGAVQSEEVRPAYGQSAYLYRVDDPRDTVAFYPEEAAVAHLEKLFLSGDERGCAIFMGSLPALQPGTIVDVGSPAGLHVEARPQSGLFAGRWGYVLYSQAHLGPPR